MIVCCNGQRILFTQSYFENNLERATHWIQLMRCTSFVGPFPPKGKQGLFTKGSYIQECFLGCLVAVLSWQFIPNSHHTHKHNDLDRGAKLVVTMFLW